MLVTVFYVWRHDAVQGRSDGGGGYRDISPKISPSKLFMG